ncbi:phosphodiester glycosidase family protein [Cesiribacter sp. SM1]|uniref:phosphodiester glycosidase family protein n=1 Tax=Cesiribacter sp. SM1 TaxID=2861196 RepID=UPI001CD4042D|nr:phosphodiester glycosidase family protein [Cesiribacter sp. SM1]
MHNHRKYMPFMSSIFSKHLFFLSILLAVNLLAARAQSFNLQWAARQDLNVLLPPSVRIYEANGTLPDGAPIRATYATIDLSDKNLHFRAVGSNTLRQTTREAYRQNHGILAINGGYFSANSSVSLLVSDGEVIAKGAAGTPVRGAFGLVNGKPEIVWPFVSEPDNSLYYYSSPKPPSAATGGARRWMASQAVGGGPVLVKEGKIRDTSKEEGFAGSHLDRHPRSAIGYLNEHTVLVMVVDGRQQASAGVTIKELARLMLEAGCLEAVNLDGGGSSALVAADEVANIPTDIPGGNRYSLRKNASALVLSELTPTAKHQVHYIDTDSRSYTERGLWRNSNQLHQYGNTASRLASANKEYNKAIYYFDSIGRNRYQLAAWWTVNTEANTREARYVVHHGNKTDTLRVNQASLSASGKWNVLGEYRLGPGDYLELIGNKQDGKLVADAIRLVTLEALPELRPRGDLRIAVISDLNSGLGAATYEWQVDSIIARIPRIWQPDLVICGGDMVAGMGVSDTSTLSKMWAGFDKHIASPLRKANIPFAFTLGNHDGPRSYPAERKATAAYWNKPESETGLQFTDRSHFPHYYSFVKDSVFVVSWDASSAEITEENLRWMATQFEKEEAKKAKFRFVIGHMPLYSVAQERNSAGNVLAQPEKLRQLLQKYKVHTYISGHQHAYYPGKRGALELLNAGAAGAGARGWLGMENTPLHTITIMDLFYEQDSITYTTYDIQQRAAKDMAVLDDNALPTVMFGINGHLLRHNVPEAQEASGVFSGFNTTAENGLAGKGYARAKISNGKLMLDGDISGLGAEARSTPLTLGLYSGRNTEEGQLLHPIRFSPKKGGSGTFKGTFDLTEELAELLSAGALYLMLRTDNQPQGILRAQLYAAPNSPPAAPSFTSHNERNVYAVRNVEALYSINWAKSADPDGDFVAYTYQVATDNQFSNLLLNKKTGRVPFLKLTEEEWYQWLGESAEGETVQLYHRIIATDGKHLSYGPAASLRLMKSHEPLEDYIEVAPPDYVFDGKIENAAGAGYGALWDKQGKLWLADYNGALIIKLQNGSPAPFSPLKSISVNGTNYSLNPVNGIGLDLDGNILVGRNRHLLKINAGTGEGMAVWEVPEGRRAITSPRVNNKGEIYAMSLFAEDPNYVLKQSIKDPATFELIRSLDLPNRILARTFDMTTDGLTLYFPNPGSPSIQKYSSKDGITYTQAEDISSTLAGCNALQLAGNSAIYTAVRSNGILPATFHFRDDARKIMWTLPLPELNGAEARGIGVSPDGETLIFCSWDKGGGFYRYTLKRDVPK